MGKKLVPITLYPLVLVVAACASGNKDVGSSAEAASIGGVERYYPIGWEDSETLSISIDGIEESPYFFSCCLHEPDSYIVFRELRLCVDSDQPAEVRDEAMAWFVRTAWPKIEAGFSRDMDSADSELYLIAVSLTGEALTVQDTSLSRELLENWNGNVEVPSAAGIYFTYSVECMLLR